MDPVAFKFLGAGFDSPLVKLCVLLGHPLSVEEAGLRLKLRLGESRGPGNTLRRPPIPGKSGAGPRADGHGGATGTLLEGAGDVG